MARADFFRIIFEKRPVMMVLDHSSIPAVVLKIILVSGQLGLATIDIPPNSRFFGKPLEANEMIAEMQDMIGRA